MSVHCTNTECPEYQVPKTADDIPPGTLVVCGECGQPCTWPDQPELP